MAADVTRHGGRGPGLRPDELSLGPGVVNVLGRFGGAMRFGPFALTSAGETDYFLAQLKR